MFLINGVRLRLGDGDLFDVLLGHDLTFGQQVKLVFGLVEIPELPDEETATQERGNGEHTVVPDQQGITREAIQCLGDGGRDGVGEECNRLNQRSHVLWSFGIGIFQRCDRGEDLTQSDQDVATSLDPDIERGWADSTVVVEAAVGLVSAGRCLVDIVLDNGGPHHSSGSSPETNSNLLESSEVEPHSSETGVQERVAEGDEDDQRERIQVVNDAADVC
jgi:hypothetical protein